MLSTSFNVSGCDVFWKVARANCCHNHIKSVGFSSRPVGEVTIVRPNVDKIKTTKRLKVLMDLVELEMLPDYECKTESMTGAAISDFLIGKGFKASP